MQENGGYVASMYIKSTLTTLKGVINDILIAFYIVLNNRWKSPSYWNNKEFLFGKRNTKTGGRDGRYGNDYSSYHKKLYIYISIKKQ